MKRLIAMAALMMTATFALPVVAQEAGKPKTKFYNFDDMLIDGAIKKPSGLLTDVRDAARFQRLLNLKKSFLPTLEKTAKEKALK